MKLADVKTPSYVIDERMLKHNLEILSEVEKKAGCKILLAQKAFSAFYEYPLIAEYISGTTASGLFEARLGDLKMHKENHCFAPAYRAEDLREIVKICDHVIFNSISQLEKHRSIWENAKNQSGKKVSVGLRINPEVSTQEGHEIYDPCAKGSRLGVTLANLNKALQEDPDCLRGVSGLHFHTLCEQNYDALEKTLVGVCDKFGKYIKQMEWLNMGGGHHITRADYEVDKLIDAVVRIREQYGVEVYLEPGEAVALNAGYLVTEVMDIVENGMKILILDASAACHMPDVLEMPYRPPLRNSGEPGEKKYTYRLSSMTCLAGDVIGDYSFDEEIKVGDKLIFEDMAIYSMVKNNTFNGMPLPSIYAMHDDGQCELIKEFSYDDFAGRLS